MCRLSAAILLFATVSLSAQNPMGHTMAMPMSPRVAPENLPVPQHMTGIGNSHITITATPEAQVWFDQGLNLLHDFWDYEATKAFEQGVRVDPKCAMCYWGLSRAAAFHGADDSKVAVHKYLPQAHALSKNLSTPEKLYIEAAEEELKSEEKQVRKKSSWDQTTQPLTHKDSAETRKLRKLVKLQPEDPQARIALAGSLHDGYFKGDPNPGTREAMQLLQQVLQKNPDDTAALHYWIHAVEPGLHPEQAADAAQKLGALTPASGHMVHMPGHIFYLMGEYDRAQQSFAQSTLVDETYMKTQHVTPDDDWNYVHNLMYSIANLMEAGHFAAADALAARTLVAHGTRPDVLYVVSARDGMARLDPALPSALRSANWAAAIKLLQASSTPEMFLNLAHLRNGLLLYAQGMAALEAKSNDAAAKFSADLASLQKEKPASMDGMKPDERDLMASAAASYLDLASQELNASVEEVQGKQAEADRDFARALELENKLGYHEPPTYLRPVEEAQGDVLFRVGRYSQARLAYQAALKRRPNSGFPLYGMAQCDEAMNSAATAASYRTFLEAWRTADEDLPQIRHALRWQRRHDAPANGE